MKRFIPLLVLCLIVGILSILNFQSGTFLTGWDNLHPEFDFWLNIKRSLFAAWQEYQGPGLLGGMGHASDLLRQVFLWILSIAIPVNQLRFVWTMLTLLIGAVGAFYLIRYVLDEKNHESSIKNYGELEEQSSSQPFIHNSYFLIPLLGALFYLLNLATIQTYYIIFETFSAHFAFLPWLLLTILIYIRRRTKRSFLYLVLTLLVATPAGYVPTLFVVFCMAAFILAVFHLNWSTSFTLLRANGRKLITLFLIIFLVNAFWMLPFGYFTLTKSKVNVNGKINQIATETIYLLNHEFGNLTDVMLLKGFWFNSVEPDDRGSYDFILTDWRKHYENPYVPAIGYGVFAIVLFGAFVSVKGTNKIQRGFVGVFLLGVTMLATDTPPFSWIDSFIRSYIPLFGQAFRFPYTKFSILTALMYSVLFAIGVRTLFYLIESRIKNSQLLIRQTIQYGLFMILASCFVFLTLPAFQGHLFYEKEQIRIPNEYFEVFKYFKNQDQNARIANFPQPTFWGWNYYSWGYSGSGFMWYGIKQPMLDRAFDVWSKESENYYFEASQALYSKNTKAFENVLNKYQVRYLLLDKNLKHPPSSKALFIPEFKDIIAKIPSISKAQEFGNIEIYNVTPKDPVEQFVFLTKDLPSVNESSWTNDDAAYQELGTYYSPSKTDPEYYYPFHFFSLKTNKEMTFNAVEKERTIEFTSSIPASSNRSVEIPSYTDVEAIIPASVVSEKTATSLVLSVVLETPSIFIDGKKISGSNIKQNIFTLDNRTLRGEFPFDLRVNDNAPLVITEGTSFLGTTFLSLREDNTLTITSKNKRSQDGIIETAAIKKLLPQKQTIRVPKGSKLRISTPKIQANTISHTMTGIGLKDSIKQCDSFRNNPVLTSTEGESLLISTTNSTACSSFYAPGLPHNQGYLLFLKSRNVKGRGLHFWIENTNLNYVPHDSYLPSSKKEETSTFILPPQDEFATSYAFHFDNISIGEEEVSNVLRQVSIYPIPYSYLTHLAITGEKTAPPQPLSETPLVSHPDESRYIVDIPANSSATTLVLSQSYDSGWKAYAIQKNPGIIQSIQANLPFLFGKELKDHIMVNNWENGWILDNSELKANNSRFLLVYLPQYLEFLGFFLLFGTLGFTAYKTLKT